MNEALNYLERVQTRLASQNENLERKELRGSRGKSAIYGLCAGLFLSLIFGIGEVREWWGYLALNDAIMLVLFWCLTVVPFCVMAGAAVGRALSRKDVGKNKSAKWYGCSPHSILGRSIILLSILFLAYLFSPSFQRKPRPVELNPKRIEAGLNRLFGGKKIAAIHESKPRVLLIGLDGVGWNWLDPLLEQDKLPNIAKLLNRGIRAELQSSVIPQSGPAWTCFMTGKNPGHFGYLTFRQQKPDSYEFRLVDSTTRNDRAVWNILNEASDKRVVVIGCPLTYPPEKVDGVLISGWLSDSASGRAYTYPGSLTKVLQEIGYRTTNFSSPVSVNEVIQQRFEVASVLMKRVGWDFFMIYSEFTDNLQHRFWKEKQTLDEHLILTDKLIGRLLDGLGSDVIVIIMSDHGFKKYNKLFNLRQWLIDSGYAAVIDRRTLDKSKKSKIGALLDEQSLGFKYRYLVGNRILEIMQDWGTLFGEATSIKFEPFSKEDFSAQEKREVGLLTGLNYPYDYDETTAYECHESRANWGAIRINVRGAKPHGIIAEGSEYERFREELILNLLEAKDEVSGSRIVHSVYRREEIFSGPLVHLLPDVIFRTEPDVMVSGQKKLSGHGEKGFLIISGKHVDKSAKVENATILDIAPTILYCLNAPLPDDMDGRVLTECFEEKFLLENPVRTFRWEKPYSRVKKTERNEEHTEEILGRLRSLGYIQ